MTESVFYGTHVKLDLYVRTERREVFERLLDYVAVTGFGRDASTGKGAFTFERDQSFDEMQLEASGTHKMCLSVFSAMNLTDLVGTYRVFAKSGRVGGALGAVNPFKRTFLAMEEGSVFERMPNAGFLLKDLHPDKRIVQVTYPLCIAFTPAKEATL